MPHATTGAQKGADEPHDALFRWTFSQRKHAVGLLKAALPGAVVKAVRWSTLRVEEGSFVDLALRSRHSDLVLSARMGAGRIYFYVLIEQQREVEALMVFRAGDLVEQALTALGKVVLWCLSVAGDDARLEREISRIADALDEVLRAPDGPAALEALLRYLVATHKRLTVKKVGNILEKTGPRAREVIVTVLDEIERRGRDKGRAEGRAEGRARTLLELLASRFGSVPVKVSARILAADEATLTTWTARLLSASTLHDVLGEGSERAPRPPTRRRSRHA